MSLRARQVGLGIALGVLSTAAQPAPAPFAAEAFPARDSHQGVTIAAVPVPDTPQAEAIFGEKAAPTRAGFLPVEVVIRNERGETVRVELEPIVVTSGQATFEQIDPDEIAWALYPPPKKKRSIDSSRLPRRVPKDKNRFRREEAVAALRHRQLRAAVVGPRSQARGYLYFDLRGQSIDLAASSLYIPDVAVIPDGERLLYFEISFEPYAKTAR